MDCPSRTRATLNLDEGKAQLRVHLLSAVGSVGEDTKKATRGRTRGVVGRLTLGITRPIADRPMAMPSPADQRADSYSVQKHDVSKTKRQDIRARGLGKKGPRKDGVAKRRAQDEDKKHSEGETADSETGRRAGA